MKPANDKAASAARVSETPRPASPHLPTNGATGGAGTTPWARWALPLALVGLAFWLRTGSLNGQSFWLDEFYAVWFIDRPLKEALRIIITPSNNGPLYFLLLWPWYRLAGQSDFAVRYFSVFCSTLTVALLWQLARAWFGRRVAGWAALLLALSPFALWFAQEAKMYALHMLLATLSTWLLYQALHRGRWWRWLAYGVAINLLGYSHFFGGLTIAVQGLSALLVTWRRPARRRAYLLTMALVSLPYWPVVRYVWQVWPQFQTRDISKQFVPLGQMVIRLWTEYTWRLPLVADRFTWLALGGVAMALLLGLVQAWRRGWEQGIWLTALLVLPPLLFYPISYKIPVFSPKYLSATFPFFITALALAVDALYRWRREVGLALLAAGLLAFGRADLRDLTDPRVQRSDWRFVAAYLQEHATPEDVILTFADYTSRVLERYYHGPTPIRPFVNDPYHPEEIYEQLREAGCRTLWLVLNQDEAMAPGHQFREAASARYPTVTEQYPNLGQIKLLGYALNWRYPALPATATPLTATFANGLQLLGYQVDTTRLPATERVSHPPSNWIHVTTYWQPAGDYTGGEVLLLAHVIDAGGGVWGAELTRWPTVFQFDPPAGWPNGTAGAEEALSPVYRPCTLYLPLVIRQAGVTGGPVIEAHVDVNLNPVTPPGRYTLVLGLQDLQGQRLPLADGRLELPLTPVEIVP